MERRRLEKKGGAEGEEAQELTLAGPKILEATCLRGRELRWQPWPETGKFNEEWAVVPMRWGHRGELFVLLQRRETGELRVCAADVHLPMERWPVLSSPTVSSSKTAKYKAFTFNEHLFVISIDGASGSLRVFHVPDP